jgi:hypothetical protein
MHSHVLAENWEIASLRHLALESIMCSGKDVARSACNHQSQTAGPWLLPTAALVKLALVGMIHACWPW